MKLATAFALTLAVLAATSACGDEGDPTRVESNRVHMVPAIVAHARALPEPERLMPGEQQHKDGCFVLQERFANTPKGGRLCNSLSLDEDVELPEKGERVMLAVVVYTRNPPKGGGSYRIIDIFRKGEENKSP